METKNEIIRVVIKGESGYCSMDYAYKDKLTITPESISYEYSPLLETEHNLKRKWSYKTNGQQFSDIYAKIVEMLPIALSKEPEYYVLDVGTIKFLLTYSDKTKVKMEHYIDSDYFAELFRIIRELVPKTEMIPELLLTSDDYEDEEDVE